MCGREACGPSYDSRWSQLGTRRYRHVHEQQLQCCEFASRPMANSGSDCIYRRWYCNSRISYGMQMCNM